MDFRAGQAAADFRAEVREFLRTHMTDEIRHRIHETGTVHDAGLYRAVARRGWVAAALPGPQGRGPEELAALMQEFEYAGAPYDGMSTSMMVAGVLQHVGSEFHRREVVSRIREGEAVVSLGYTEPGCGSDVAACITRAVRDGEEWVIDGQKMWTSLAEVSSFIFLLTRTNSEVAKHRGLTFFLVPTDSPGIEIQPIATLRGKRSNTTFYDGVHVHDRWRVGEVDGGWDVMKVALAFERGVMGGISDGVRLLEAACAHAEGTVLPDGTRPIDDPTVREQLARTAIDNEVADLLGACAVWIAATGALPGVEGSAAKLFASEAYTRASSWFLDMLGPEGVLQEGEPRAPVNGFLELCHRTAPVTTIWGGTSEIQRNNIAERALRLPRAR